MASKKHNFTLEQGASYNRIFLYTDDKSNPHDISAYEARIQVRLGLHSSGYITAYDTGNPPIPDTEILTVEPGGGTGQIVLAFNAVETGAFSFDMAHYTLELYKDADPIVDVIRVCQGVIRLDKKVQEA